MIELKVIDLGDIRNAIENDESVYYEYYPKSEADKKIAELNAEIKRLMDWNKKETGCHLEIERHSKYKRCLKIAESCLYKVWYYDEVHDRNGASRMWKWRERWLDIAKQVKED